MVSDLSGGVGLVCVLLWFCQVKTKGFSTSSRSVFQWRLVKSSVSHHCVDDVAAPTSQCD